MVEKPGDSSLSRLKMLYIQAKELSENEVAYVYPCILSYVSIFFLNFLLNCYFHLAVILKLFFNWVQCFESVDKSVGCSNTFWASWATAKKNGCVLHNHHSQCLSSILPFYHVLATIWFFS